MLLQPHVLSLLALSLTVVEALPVQQFTLKPYSQEALDQYNVLRFLGTAAPYVANPGYGIEREAPFQCKVTQANLFGRHGERYPTDDRGEELTESLSSIRNNTEKVEGPLSFLKDYEFRALDKNGYNKESSSGPYAGLLQMYQQGSYFRDRYWDLYKDGEDIKFYAASSLRVVASAEKFAEGFLGQDYNKSYIEIIDEDDASLGANSLTPVTSCSKFDKKLHKNTIKEFSDSFLNSTADRLNKQSPGINLTADQVETLMYYCGYDLDVDGSNKICEIFTTSELSSYAYKKDVEYYYEKGPGNNMSAIIGSVYVNAVIDLLKDHDRNLTLSFAHDSDLFYIISALGIYDGDLPVKYQDFNHLWQVSNIAPMAARLVIERLTCEQEDDESEDYVRLILNDAVIPIPGHSDGPGFSLSVNDFEEYIADKLNGHSYAKDCGLKQGMPTNMTLYWE